MRLKLMIVTMLATLSTMVVGAVPALAQESDGGGGSEPSRGVIEPEPAMQLWVGEVIVRVEGEAVRGAPAGTPADLIVGIQNGTDSSVRDVTLTLKDPPSNARVIDGTASVATIDAQKFANVTLKVEMAEAGCEDFAGFSATLTSSLGTTETKLGFPVLCPGPRLHSENVRYRGGDGDQIVEPGEKLDVFVTVRNTGRDPATDVRGTVSLTSEDVTLVDGSASWPDIAPDGTAENTTPFVIQVDADAKEQEGCSFMRGGEMLIDPVAEGGSEGSGSTEEAPAPRETTTGDDSTVSTDDTPVSSDGEQPASDSPQTLPDDGREPAPISAGVGFDAQMKLTASGRSFDAGFGTQMVCAMAEMGAPDSGRPATGGDGDEKTAAARDLAAQPTGAKGTARSSAIAIAAVLLLAAATIVGRYRLTH